MNDGFAQVRVGAGAAATVLDETALLEDFEVAGALDFEGGVLALVGAMEVVGSTRDNGG